MNGVLQIQFDRQASVYIYTRNLMTAKVIVLFLPNNLVCFDNPVLKINFDIC